MKPAADACDASAAGLSHRSAETLPLLPDDQPSAALQQRWLLLTRTVMPALARERDWPVSADHCFQRILLDNACGGPWYDHVSGRPAYRHASPDLLERAALLGEAAVADEADLQLLNARSLAWRRAARRR